MAMSLRRWAGWNCAKVVRRYEGWCSGEAWCCGGLAKSCAGVKGLRGDATELCGGGEIGVSAW